MSACYDVVLRIKFQNENEKKEALSKINEYIERTLNHLETENLKKDNFVKVIGFLLADNQDMFEFCGIDKLGYEKYISAFNASYSWERVLIEIFEIMAPYLKNRSSCRIGIECDYDMLVIKNNKCVQTH